MQPDVLIIGGGPSAMTAALYLLRSGRSVTLLERENFGGQIADSPKVENFPSIKSISGLDFSNNLYEQIVALGADTEMDEALKVSKKDDLFVVEGKYENYSSKALIIASGVKHRHLGAEGEDRLLGHGVSYCAVCDGPFYAGKDVVLIGDANSALQYALLLSSICHHVDLVTLFDRFFADQMLVKALLSLQNVTIYHNKNATSFNGKDNLESVSFVDTKTGEKKDFACQGAFVAIGQVPDNERFLPLVELDKGYIKTDENGATLTKGLFASGDCTNEKVRQLTTACGTAAIAALSANNYLFTI